MDCSDVRDLFSDYIENQLNEEDLIIFEKHMEQCSKCRDEFYKFEKMIIRLKSIKDIDPPKDLSSKIMNKIISEENKKLNAKIINFRKFSSIAAAFIIIIFGGVYYQNNLAKKPIDINNAPIPSKAKIISENEDFQVKAVLPENDGAQAFNQRSRNIDTNEELNGHSNTNIDLYYAGIDVTISSNNIKELKLFLEQCAENIKLYDENFNYLEIVVGQDDFLKIEERLNNIKDYSVIIQNIDEIKSQIKQLIKDEYITEKGLIKFKITLKEI